MADRPLPRSVPSPPLVNKYLTSFMSGARTARNPPLTNLAHDVTEKVVEVGASAALDVMSSKNSGSLV